MVCRSGTSICIILLVIMATIIYKTDGWSHMRSKIIGPTPEPELSTNFYIALAFHKKIDLNLPPNPILFIGDSHVQGLAVSAVTSDGVNFGIGGDTTLGVLHRLPQYTSVQKSKAIVLAIGFNDLKRRNNKTIVQNISLILDKIPADIPVLLCGVMPVDEGPQNLVGFNERIRKLNKQIVSLNALRTNILFLDPIQVLGNQTGSLPSNNHIGDGIHLTEQGYDLWINAMISGLVKLGAKKPLQP